MSGKRPAEPVPGRAGKRGKKEVMAKFSDAVTEETLKKQVAEAWSRRTPFRHEAIVMDMDPFLHCVIPNFIESENFLEGLQKELLNLDFHEKYNDLYKFQQETILSSFSFYLTDALLCHDDELEGRRIAFILYLVPPWDRSLGGTLDLYNVDEHFQPKQIVKSLIPSWNTLVFFEVSPVSFHQVSEVLSEEKSRLSISGWFHGPSLTRPPTYFEPLIPRSPHIPQDHEILYDWINPTYLDMEYQVQIQEEFEESSEILLKEFLKPEKFAEVCEALEKGDVEWSSRGPPNKRFYEKAEESKLPDILKDCMALFRSETMFLLLSNFTGLKLHFLAPSEEGELEDKKEGEAASAADDTEEGPSRSSEPESRRAAISSSSQQSNEQTDPEPEENDAKKGWEPEYGGFTSYIAKGEDEE
ncbi:hypothetical protein J1605_020186 [Eschrichtius robustus]|uniref:Prolyl 3-hydroxylase OGFOD1 n=1 Tax=Eschrichtius robustus TaxID=9764 RepID=A0AB34HLN8_ESCRO|nr:hypothetical protein J1605_020186 [Eschrichtius robustus]